MEPRTITFLAISLISGLCAVFLFAKARKEAAKAIAREICDLIDHRSYTNPEAQKVDSLGRLEKITGMKLMGDRKGPRIVNKPKGQSDDD